MFAKVFGQLIFASLIKMKPNALICSSRKNKDVNSNINNGEAFCQNVFNYTSAFPVIIKIC